MAKIEGQLRVGISNLARAPRSNAAETVAAGFADVQRGVNDLQKLSQSLMLGQMQRANERSLHAAEIEYRTFKTDLLYGENGIAKAQGQEAEGMTQRAATRLNEFLQEKAKTAPNHVVRTALSDRIQRDISQTNDYLARHEADRLERHRISQSGALYEGRRQEATQIHRERLMPDQPEYQEEVAERLRLHGSMNPGMSAEEVALHVRTQMADDGLKAVFSLMDEGPERANEALRMIETYEGEWDERQRVAARRRVEDEVGFGLMEGTIAETSRDNPGHTRLDLVEKSTERFKQKYEATFGRSPRDELVQENKRRAEAWDRLVDDDIKERRDAERDAAVTGFIQTTLEGKPGDVEADFQRLVKGALSSQDTDLLNGLLTLKSNYDKSQTIFASEISPKGQELWLLPEGHVLPQNEILAAAGHMTATEWKTWAPRHTSASAVKKLEAGGSETVSFSEIDNAINRYRTNVEGRAKYAAKDQEFGSKRAQLTQMSDSFVLQNKRKPSREELDSMVHALNLDFDDAGFDSFSGTIGQFISNPTGVVLNPTDSRDKFILNTALNTARLNPKVQEAVEAELGHGFLFSEMRPEDLVKFPELTAAILEYALVSDAPIFRDPNVGPITPAQLFQRAGDVERAD